MIEHTVNKQALLPDLEIVRWKIQLCIMFCVHPHSDHGSWYNSWTTDCGTGRCGLLSDINLLSTTQIVSYSSYIIN